MNYINIFIASSIVEFEHERLQLSDFIRSLNDIYQPRGVYFQLTLCEDLSNAVAKKRKQDEYNQKVREAQYFYVLFGKGTDREDDAAYTVEEFHVAREQFLKTGAPNIYTYFRKLPQGESANQNILDFLHRLQQEIEHYTSDFTVIDTIKLDMLLEFTRDPAVGGTVKIQDSMASLDGHDLLSVENIPLYSKNKAVQNLLNEKVRLEEEYSRLAQQYKESQSDDALQLLLENSGKRNQINDQLHALEMDVLNLFRSSAEKRRLGQALSWRERDALKMIDEGNYEGAKLLLEDPVRKKEIAQAEEIIDAKRADILEYISEQKTLIGLYKAEDITAETARRVIAAYEDTAALAEKYHSDLDVLYDYALYLYDLNQYSESFAIARRLEHWYALGNDISDKQKAALNNLLGIIYNHQKDFTAAEHAYRTALKDIENTNSDEVQAIIYNNLANLLYTTNSPQEAEALYREALKIRRESAKKNPDTSA